MKGWLTKQVVRYLGGLMDQRMIAWVSGRDGASGRVVSVDSALQIATCWACVRLLAETIATLPLVVYHRGEKGKREAAKDHPLHMLLHDAPNADMTAVEFWELMMSGLLLWGNSFARKEMLGRRLIALTWLRPDLMTVRRQPTGEIQFIYAAPGGRREVYAEDEIFHIKNFSIDGLVGLSPVAQARGTLGLAASTSEAAAKLYANGLRTAGIMSSDATLTPTQRAQAKTWVDDFRDKLTSGGIPLVEGGFKFNQISLSPEDAQMLQTWSFTVEEICRWYRVPPFMVGHTEKVTSWGSGLEQQMIGFLTFSLRPYLTRIEQAVRRSLLPPEERSEYYAEFLLEGLMRADSAGRAALYAVFAQNGIATRNELRERENMAPIEGGDELTVQSNMLPIGLLGRAGAPLLKALQEMKSALIGHNGGPPMEDK